MSTGPIVIAHRGASGYLPEHTLAAKALAYGLGADFLEQDVVATRDEELVVLHDLYLDDVSDVARRFPGRQRDDGLHYVIDFDLAELKTLTLFERRARGAAAAKYGSRFPSDAGLFGVAALREELCLVRGLNASMGRSVGVYTEIKHPAWHRRHGVDLGKRVLDELHAFGYSAAQDPAYVQCFDAVELERLKVQLGAQLRLIQLVGPEAEYSGLLQPPGLRRVAAYAHGLGPHYSQLVQEQGTRRPGVSTLTHQARDAGLRLHAYTFRRDELPGYSRTLGDLLELFLGEVCVDGVFCDHPDVAVRVRDALWKVQ
jgi:glycerophosphoryl diester phosphodiesterase